MTEVVHARDRETALAEVRARTGDVTVVWPEVPLAELVELMQSEARVAGVVDGAAPDEVADAGIEHVVHDAVDARACMRAIAAHLAARSTPDTLATAVEQVADELVTNALFDAPVDVHGKQLFEGISARRRVRLRADRKVRVRLRADGKRATLVVTDGFGSLRRATLLRTLYKCVHTERPVDNRDEGAGVGMYLALSAATQLRCEVRPNHSTEITATFEHGVTRTQLVFVTHATVAAPAPAKLVRLPDPRVARAIALAIPLVTVALAVALPSATPVVTVTSEPAGAMITLDGHAIGTTPLTRSLAVGTARLDFALPGHMPAHTQLTVIGAHSVHRALAASPQRARARITSEPAGAVIVATGQRPGRERRFTPAVIEVEAGVTQQFTLEMPGHAPAVIAPFTVTAGAIVDRHLILHRAP